MGSKGFWKWPLCLSVAVVILMTFAGQAAASPTAVEFFARSPLRGGLSCAIYDGYGGAADAFCEAYGPPVQAKATLYPSGKLVVCRSHDQRANRCDLGNAGERTPTYGYGRKVTVGRFQCVVLRKGVRCIVRSTGKGFLMNPRRTWAVGGAVIGKHDPGSSVKEMTGVRHLEEFLSPDHKVWCQLGKSAAVQFCATGGFQFGSEPQSTATFRQNGTVTTCSVAAPSVAEGCIGNWDTSAPVLAYGESSELNGIRCTSATDGITCIKLAGAGKGKGFRIDGDEVVRVG